MQQLSPPLSCPYCSSPLCLFASLKTRQFQGGPLRSVCKYLLNLEDSFLIHFA